MSLYVKKGKTGAVLTVNAPSGATVTAKKGEKEYTRISNESGIAIFKGLSTGTWTINLSSSGQDTSPDFPVQITSAYEITADFFTAEISVIYPEGNVCTCTSGLTVLNAPDTSGEVVFTIPALGEWTISCTDGSETASETVTITEYGQSETVELSHREIPEFTFSGTYAIYNDSGEAISDLETYRGDWQIHLLTSGIFKFLKLHGAKDGIDIFMAAGGAGGRGAAYTGHTAAAGGPGHNATHLGIAVTADVEYPVVIGSGAAGNGGNGGDTSAFEKTVSGGGADGSGGTATYPFGSADMGRTVYSQKGTGVIDNTGNSGYGGSSWWDEEYGSEHLSHPSAGSSGIVIIRNRREAA